MNLAEVREWLLAEAAWPDLPFAHPPARRPLDYPARLVDVLLARLTSRNPPVPPWRRRAAGSWQRIGTGPGPLDASGRSLLYGVVAAWNEDDVIYATVRHLRGQGCHRVFVLDDGSDDHTAFEAHLAGADVVVVTSDGVYREATRCRVIGALIAEQTEHAGGDVWWLVADADEFPRGYGGRTVGEVVDGLPGWVDTVGSRVIEHLPHAGASYAPRTHPVEAFPHAHVYRNPYCGLGHWKHQLLRCRQPGDLVPMPGHHTLARADGQAVREWPDGLLMHHVPLRDRERTANKLAEAARTGGRYARSPDSFTRWRLDQRRKALDLLYDGRTGEVPNWFPGMPATGMELTDWRRLVPDSERFLERWDY